MKALDNHGKDENYKIILVEITNASFIKEGCVILFKKYIHYCNIEYHEFPRLKTNKKHSINEQKIERRDTILHNNYNF
jgi:hypothetical protein